MRYFAEYGSGHRKSELRLHLIDIVMVTSKHHDNPSDVEFRADTRLWSVLKTFLLLMKNVHGPAVKIKHTFPQMFVEDVRALQVFRAVLQII